MLIKIKWRFHTYSAIQKMKNHSWQSPSQCALLSIFIDITRAPKVPSTLILYHRDNETLLYMSYTDNCVLMHKTLRDYSTLGSIATGYHWLYYIYYIIGSHKYTTLDWQGLQGYMNVRFGVWWFVVCSHHWYYCEGGTSVQESFFTFTSEVCKIFHLIWKTSGPCYHCALTFFKFPSAQINKLYLLYLLLLK